MSKRRPANRIRLGRLTTRFPGSLVLAYTALVMAMSALIVGAFRCSVNELSPAETAPAHVIVVNDREHAEVVEWAFDRFRLAGLSLPPIRISVFATYHQCGLRAG